MFAWIKRSILRLRTPLSAETPVRVREISEEDITAVEDALLELLAAGIRLGPRYSGLPSREAARRIAKHGEFSTCRAEALATHSMKERSIAVLWSMRDWYGLPKEHEFHNAALFEDHCYDGATEADYEWVTRRVMDLTDVWTCRSVTAVLSNVDDPIAGECAITIDAEPPIRSFRIETGKDFDWRLIERLAENLPASTTRQFGLAADGGAALVVFLEPDEMQRLEDRLGFEFCVVGSP